MHRGSYLYFDRDGIVVESSRIKLEDIPVITGLNFSRIVLHEQLKVQKEEMFTVILSTDTRSVGFVISSSSSS